MEDCLQGWLTFHWRETLITLLGNRFKFLSDAVKILCGNIVIMSTLLFTSVGAVFKHLIIISTIHSDPTLIF